MQDKSDAQDTWLVDRVNTLINDPDAPAISEIPNGNEPNPMAGVLTGNVVHREPMNNVVSEELLNNTLAGFPGGADAFWEGMQGSGIGREDLMHMLASEMHPVPRNPLLTPRDS